MTFYFDCFYWCFCLFYVFFFLFFSFAVPFSLLYLVINWYVVSAFWNALNSINYSKHELLHWSCFAVTWCNFNGKTHKIIMTFGIKILTLDAAPSLALSLSFDFERRAWVVRSKGEKCIMRWWIEIWRPIILIWNNRTNANSSIFH